MASLIQQRMALERRRSFGIIELRRSRRELAAFEAEHGAGAGAEQQ